MRSVYPVWMLRTRGIRLISKGSQLADEGNADLRSERAVVSNPQSAAARTPRALWFHSR